MKIFVLLLVASCGMSPQGKRKQRGGGSEPTQEAQGTSTATGDVSAAVPAEKPADDERDVDETKPTLNLADIPVSVGVRNFAEISETMSTLTGVSPNNTAVAAALVDLSSQLPLTHDIRSFVSSHQVAVTKLAVEYCDQLFEDTQLRAQFLPGVNFAAAPSTVLNATSELQIASVFIDRFWGKDLNTRPDVNGSRAALVQLFGQILQGKNLATVALTKNAIKGVCVATLSAAPVIIM